MYSILQAGNKVNRYLTKKEQEPKIDFINIFGKSSAIREQNNHFCRQTEKF